MIRVQQNQSGVEGTPAKLMAAITDLYEKSPVNKNVFLTI
jgi:hypothetical protein